MPLPWVRLDSNIGSHDKILALLSDPSVQKAVKFQAAFSYCVALGWSGGQGTDGEIPRHALPFCHGTKQTARLLVTYRLWTETLTGWHIVNFEQRQELESVSAGKREAMRVGAAKGNCKRWHGDTCWRDGRCSRESA